MSKKGWVRKSTETTEDEYPTGGGQCQKRGGSESQQKQQKMNIQQEVGNVKKGVGQKVNRNNRR